MLFDKTIKLLDFQINSHKKERSGLLDLENKINTLDEDDRLAVYIYIFRYPSEGHTFGFDIKWVNKVFEYTSNKAKRQLKDDCLWDTQEYCRYMEYSNSLLREMTFEQAVRVAKASIEVLGKFK